MIEAKPGGGAAESAPTASLAVALALALALFLSLAPVLAFAVALALARSAAALGPGLDVARAVQPAPTVLRDLAYVSGPDFDPSRHRLDLFIPAERPFPLVHFVHGGGWASGDKQEVPGERYDNVALALSDAGLAVSLINYRLSDGGPSSVMHPEHARDVARAIAFSHSLLIARGTRATDHIVLGHEAGAHLAALVATNPRFLGEHGLSPVDIRGVVGLSGVYDIPPLGDSWPEVFGLDPEVRLDASPRRFVEHADADFLLLVAGVDRPGHPDQARDFADALVDAGRAAVAETIAGRDHAGLVERFGQDGDPVAERVIRFIAAVRATPPSPAPSPTTPRVESPTPSSSPPPADTATPTATSSVHTPPGQPARGPGGAERPYAAARTESGAGWRVHLPAPLPATPTGLVVFVPDPVGRTEGAGEDADPYPYQAWFDHLARGGFAVVVPESASPERPLDTASVVAALRGARDSVGVVAALEAEGVIWAGHGSGATTATVLAAEWFVRRMAPPRALFVVDPKRPPGDGTLPWLGPPYLPNHSAVVFVALEDAPRSDPFVEPALWRAAERVAGARRTRIELRSDRYGQPWLEAGATTPLTEAPGRLDALDWYGTWRALDALAACANSSTWCADVFGDPSEVRHMGRWSDGHPVAAARISDGPPPAPWIRIALPALGSEAR